MGARAEAVYKLNWLESVQWTSCSREPSVKITCGSGSGEVELIRTENHLGGEAVNCTSSKYSGHLECTSSYELATTSHDGPVVNADIVFRCRIVGSFDYSDLAADAFLRFSYQCDGNYTQGNNISAALRLLINDNNNLGNFTLGSGCRLGYPSESGFCVNGGHNCGTARSLPHNHCSQPTQDILVQQILPVPHLPATQQCPSGFSNVSFGYLPNSKSSDIAWSFTRISDDTVVQEGRSGLLEEGQPYRSPLGCLANNECYVLSTTDAKAEAYGFGLQLDRRWIEYDDVSVADVFASKVSRTPVGLSTTCGGAPWLRAVYRVEWRHFFFNDCSGFIPHLRMDCSNGGFAHLRQGVGGRCISSSRGSIIDCDFFLKNDTVYNETAIFSCDGYASAPLPIVTSLGQKMTCPPTLNVSSHGIRVSYFDFSRGIYVEGGSCAQGRMQDGFCMSEGSCSEVTGICSPSLDNVVAHGTSPLPAGAELDLTALFTTPAVLESTLSPTLSPTPSPTPNSVSLARDSTPTLYVATIFGLLLGWAANEGIF